MVQAEVLSTLSHRNIVQFLGAVTVAPNYCLVTGEENSCVCNFLFNPFQTSEFVEFGSLYEYLRKYEIDIRQILLWAKQIALGNYIRTHISCSGHSPIRTPLNQDTFHIQDTSQSGHISCSGHSPIRTHFMFRTLSPYRYELSPL